MHKVDAPGATPEGEFQDGNPGQGVEATLLGAKWHNTIQRELVKLVEDTGQTLDDANDAQVLEAVQRLAGIKSNAVINGDFSVWNRGGTFRTLAGGTPYQADRWKAWMSNTTGGQATFQKQIAGSADAALIESSTFARVTGSPAAATQAVTLRTQLEDLTRFASRVMTFRFRSRRSGTATISVRISQLASNGGAENVVLNATGIALGASWQDVEYELTLPSVDNLTISADSRLRIDLTINASESHAWTQWDVAAVQLVDGKYAGRFPAREPGVERTLCARYYQNSASEDLAFPDPDSGRVIGNGSGVAALYNLGRRLLPMRGTPAVAWSSSVVPATPASGGNVEVAGVSQGISGVDGRTSSYTGWPMLTSGTAATSAVVSAYYAAFADFDE